MDKNRCTISCDAHWLMPLIVWREAGASSNLRYIPESPGMPKQDFLQRLIGRSGSGNRDVAWKDMNRTMGTF